MPLCIQIYSLLFSFIYGIFFFILLDLNYKLLYSDRVFIKLSGTLVFVIFNTLLYFVCLKRINNGIIHIYFLLCIIVGYLFSKYVIVRLINRFK